MSTPPTNDRASRPDAGRERRTPDWVMVLGVIVIVLLVAFAVSRLFGIQHGPDLHSWLPAADLVGRANFMAA